MKIDYSLERNFPNLANWIRSELPATLKISKIMIPFRNFGEMTNHEAVIALSDNKMPPIIDIKVMQVYGTYQPRFKRNLDRVFINRKMCRQFEKMDPDQRVNTSHGRIMLSTILHEIVHWGDYKDRIKQPNADIYDPAAGKLLINKDVGFQFETEAFYGIYTDKYLNMP